jgi:hypothetical protein
MHAVTAKDVYLLGSLGDLGDQRPGGYPVYIVRSGDYPVMLSKRWTGSENNYKAMAPINPQATGNGAWLKFDLGDTINVPWEMYQQAQARGQASGIIVPGGVGPSLPLPTIPSVPSSPSPSSPPIFVPPNPSLPAVPVLWEPPQVVIDRPPAQQQPQAPSSFHPSPLMIAGGVGAVAVLGFGVWWALK